MNVIGFIRLLRTIYSKELPDLDFIQRQGLLAVKIGQTYALRLDFLNEDTCKHLGKLFRNVDSISADDMEKLLDSYVDKEWRSSFINIDKTPLASASVGQVHRGQLTDGQDVVIKIIKTDFRKRFIRDVTSLRRFVKFILFFYPKLAKVADPLGIIDTIETGTLDELDLCKEIDGHDRLKSIYEKNRTKFDLSKLSFPIIHRNLSNTNILVSEYIEGKTFDELLDEKKMTYDMLLDLFHLHGFYVFCIGTFHGDIHPGNIILRDGQIYFLDTGVISTVGKKMRVGLFDFFDSLSEYDYVKCAENLNRMAERSISGDAYEQFQEKFLYLYRDYTNSTVSQVSLTKKMMETIKLGVNSGMVFEKGMYPIIKSLMYLDGMVLRCNPDAMLVKDMRRFIEDFKSIVYNSAEDAID
ncbi:AarF/UbiB family protein [Candidatus Latescibacterota bacterium]